jgi:transcription initiation factor TFIIIB Brf1 subunit/transcription initiation factor TFIIB
LKYKKIGDGKVLRCWEEKITRIYGEVEEEELICSNCGNIIGEVKTGRGTNYVDMDQPEFTYSGTKISK